MCLQMDEKQIKIFKLLILFESVYQISNFDLIMKKNISLSTLPNASWAHKHGISKQNNGAFAFGLNPNLNIEDDYIENLLKQIHFMTMEIKLLKQKQQQSEGNSLWGVVNRTHEPLVKNIVDSNQKYQTMKKQTDNNIHKTEYQNIRLGDQQNALIKKMNYLQKKIEDLKSKKAQCQNLSENKQQKLKQKICEYQNKMKGILSQKQTETKKCDQLSHQQQTLLLETEREKFHTNCQQTKIKNEEQIEEYLLSQKIKQIQALKSKIQNIKQSIENSQQYQRAREDQINIRQKITKVSKDIACSDFQLLQLNQSINLAQKQKQKQIFQRKRLMQEYEALKKILKEIKALNQIRINQQIQNRKRQSLDIQKGQFQTKRLQKSLEEVKKKLSRSQDSEKILKQEVEHMERELQKLKTKRQQILQNVNKLVNQNDKQDTVLSNCRNQFRKVNDQYEKITGNQLNASCDLNDLQTQIVHLRERKQYLSEVLNLKEALNQTKIQQLQKVVQKNRDVNQTVGVLMQKWEQIRNFSKI